MKPSAMLVLGQLLPLFTYAFMGFPQLEVPPEAPKKVLDVAIYTASEDPCRLYIRFDNPGQQSVSVTLRNERDETLFATRTRRPKYNLRLNLADLANGSYAVRVTDRDKAVVRTLRIATVAERPRQVISLK
jgi:hypothetical protein